jgi:DNA gyrase subunit A
MPGQEIMLISSTGTLVRTAVDEISVQGRNTQGVRLIRLGDAERLVGIERIEGLDAGDESAEAESAPAAEPASPAADTPSEPG